MNFDRFGPLRANARPSPFAALCGLPLVGPELLNNFGVGKTS